MSGTEARKGREKAEPEVINDKLLRKKIIQYFHEKKIHNQNDIPFAQVVILSLSYENIKQIQNLDDFTRLEHLQLDNNLIRKIEGLSTLVNLKWLDLSFNNIVKIEGLEKVDKLEDLSLYNNLIEKVENLSHLKKLQVLSLGNNKITKYMEMITHLSPLKHLEVLNTAGNPFVKEPDYKAHIILKLKFLKYLDYVFIDEDTRKKMGVGGPDDRKMKGFDLEDEQELKRKAEEKQMKKMKENHLEKLVDLEKKLLEYEDLPKLLKAEPIKSSFEESVQTFMETVRNAIETLKTYFEAKKKDMKDQVAEYEQGVKIIEKEAEEHVLVLLQSYYSKKKKIEQKREDDAGPEWDEKLADLKDEIMEIDDQLMEIEMNCHERISEQCELVISKVKSIVSDIESELSSISISQTIMVALKEVYKAIEKEGLNEVEKYEAEIAKNGPDFKPEGFVTDGSDDDITELMNKEDFKQLLASCREQGETHITTTETNIRAAIGQERTALQAAQQEMLVERNRKAIKNFIEFVEKETNDINEKLAQQQIEDD